MARRPSMPRPVLYGPDTKYGARAKKGLRNYVYYVVGTVDGRRIDESTGVAIGPTVSAKDAHRQAIAIAAGYSLGKRPDKTGLSLAEVLSLYIRERPNDPDRPMADPAQVGRFVEKATFAANRMLRSIFDGKRVDEVDVKLCRDYYAERIESVSHNSVISELAVLKAAINWSAQMGRYSLVPRVWIPRNRVVKRPSLSKDDVERIRAAARTLTATPWLSLYIELCVHFAHRRSAILTLQWAPNPDGGHVDLANRWIDFRRGSGHQTLKRRSAGEIPADLMLLLELQGQRNSQWVFPYKNNKPLRSMRKSWSQALKIAGLNAGRSSGGFTPHDLCHAAITHKLNSGELHWEVAKLTGRSLNIIDSVYAHRDEDPPRQSVRQK